MTSFPDPNLGRPLYRPGSDVDTNVPDIVPPTERNQDPMRSAQSRDLASGNVEPKPEDRAESVAERVYAPASERVPKQPVPGHREVIEHTDTHTREREAATPMGNGEEPSFTRVARPSVQPVSTTPGAYASPTSNPGLIPDEPAEQPRVGRQKMFFGIGASWVTVVGCAVGIWLFMRWRAERNKPINRLRRRAREAWQRADEWRERMPISREDAARPAAGLGSVLLPLLILMWRQSQTRSRQEEAVGRAERVGRQADRAARRAAQRVSEVDWQQRLMQLKERWNPSRLEQEKIQISRH